MGIHGISGRLCCWEAWAQVKVVLVGVMWSDRLCNIVILRRVEGNKIILTIVYQGYTMLKSGISECRTRLSRVTRHQGRD